MIELKRMRDIFLESGYRVYEANNRKGLYFFTQEPLEDLVFLSKCIGTRGIYVFGPENGEVDADWLLRVQQQIYNDPYLLFLWIYVDGSVETQLQLSGKWNASTASATVDNGASFFFGNCRAKIYNGITITYEDSQSQFLFNGMNGISFGLSGRELKYLHNLKIPVGDTACGCIMFQYTLNPEKGKDVFEDMDMKIKYTLALPQNDETNMPFYTISSSLLWSQNSEVLSVCVDPMRPENTDRTYISMEKKEFPSFLLTAGGRPVRLRFLDHPKFVFQKEIIGLARNQYGQLEAETKWYLCPKGFAEVLFPEGTTMQNKRLLCGLSGTEYVKLSNKERDVIEFVHNQSAFFPDETDGGSTLLTPLSTTCWIRFPNSIQYYNAPETASLFQEGKENALTYVQFITSQFHGRPPAVPIMPYRGVQGVCSDIDTNLMKCVESRIYQCRQQELTVEHIPVSRQEKQTGPETICVTPQGLVVGVDSTFGKWKWVGFGKSSSNTKMQGTEEKSNENVIAECVSCADNRICCYSTQVNGQGEVSGGTTDPDAPDVRLENLSDRFCKQLQQKEIFIVFHSPNEFLRNACPSKTFKIDCDAWSFLLHPNEWRTEHGNGNTLMLMKYGESQSIGELMADSPVFQESVRQSLDEENQVKKGFEEFNRIVNDRKFQGILFLNCPIKVNEKNLPEQLKWITNDIDTKRFYAHYLAFSRNQISQNKAQKLVMAPSSIFGAVQYRREGETEYQEHEPELDYSLIELSFSIFNAKIINFSSVSELLIRSMFGAHCKKAGGSNGDYLLLDGSYHPVGEMGEYRFSLREPGEYRMMSSAIETVLIKRIGFCVNAQQDGGFLLGGRMFFRQDETCDLFSFGREEGGSEKMGLAFEGLRLVRRWESGPDVPSTKPVLARMFADYNMVTVLPQDSEGRTNSFGKRFACRIAKIVVQEDGKSPDDLGYRSITCRLQQDTLQKPWCGLVWEINLGSLGAMSKGTQIVIRLLTACSANETGDAPAYYIGVQLPTALGGEGLDFQGLVKLGFHSVSLENADEDPGNYTLRLHNFTLRLLGLSLPPGVNDIFLFSDGDKIGWYASYLNEK